jgi:hypothetical protein
MGISSSDCGPKTILFQLKLDGEDFRWLWW